MTTKDDDEKQPFLSITTDQLDPEEAETSNIAHLESMVRPREQKNNPSDGRPSILAVGKQSNFRNAARRLMLLQKLKSQRSSRISTTDEPHHAKKRSSLAAVDLLNSIAIYSTTDMYGNLDKEGHTNDTAAMYQSAGISVLSDDEEEEDAADVDEEEHDNKQKGTLPYYGTMADNDDEGENHPRPSKSVVRTPGAIFPSSAAALWKKCFCRCRCNHPLSTAKRFFMVLAGSYLVWVAIPCFIIAAILYYGLGNPPWNFIPGTAHSAWMLNFVGRQVMTFELARLTQWLVLDCILLGSRMMSKLLGPVVIMTAVQSRGWPFLVASWAYYDLLLLCGDGQFQSHWLYWTDMRLYTVSNSGQYILTSDIYHRFLICMIVTGIVTTAKRMFLTIHFGRRMLGKSRPHVYFLW
jgi:hypothetical protein